MHTCVCVYLCTFASGPNTEHLQWFESDDSESPFIVPEPTVCILSVNWLVMAGHRRPFQSTSVLSECFVPSEVECV